MGLIFNSWRFFVGGETRCMSWYPCSLGLHRSILSYSLRLFYHITSHLTWSQLIHSFSLCSFGLPQIKFLWPYHGWTPEYLISTHSRDRKECRPHIFEFTNNLFVDVGFSFFSLCVVLDIIFWGSTCRYPCINMYGAASMRNPPGSRIIHESICPKFWDYGAGTRKSSIWTDRTFWTSCEAIADYAQGLRSSFSINCSGKSRTQQPQLTELPIWWIPYCWFNGEAVCRWQQ